MTTVWNQVQSVSDKLTQEQTTLTKIQDEVGQIHQGQMDRNTEMSKIWDKLSSDHELLMKDDALLHNWVHPDRGDRGVR